MPEAQWIVLGVALAVTVTGTAYADDSRRVSVEAIFDETYDSNVAQSDAALAAQRGIKPSDDIVSPGVAVDIAVPFGAESAYLKGSATYDFHTNNPLLNSQAVNLNAGVVAGVRECKVSLTTAVNDARTNLSQLAGDVARNIENSESAGLGLDCGGRNGFAPVVSVSEDWSDNSAAQLHTSDFRSTTVRGGFAYRRPDFGDLSLIGTYVQTDFPNRGVPTGQSSTGDGYNGSSVGLRYDRHLGARIQGSFEVSYTTLQPYLTSVTGYSGLDYRADGTVRLSGRLQVEFTAERAATPTIVSDSTYDLERTYSVAADYLATPKVTLRLSGVQTSDSYHGADFVSGLDIRHDSSWTAKGLAHLKLNRRFAVELWASHEVRKADIDAYNFTDDRAGLSISVAI